MEQTKIQQRLTDFQLQLKDVNDQIQKLSNRREQLIGAIFALKELEFDGNINQNKDKE